MTSGGPRSQTWGFMGGTGDYQPGSREDFDRLYRDCYPRLVRTLYGVLGDAPAAEDCVQEAFLSAFRAWPRYRAERPPEAWLYRIAMNTAISYRRRQKLREIGEVLRRLGRPDPGADPAEHVEASDVVDALRRLPPRTAATFILRHHHGYNNRQIADRLGVSERTVGARLVRARQALQARLGPAWARPLPPSALPDVTHLRPERNA